MPLFTVTTFEFDPRFDFGTNLTGQGQVGTTVTLDQATWDATFGAPQGSMVVDDDNDIFQDENTPEGGDGIADVTNSDGEINTGELVELERKFTFEWVDGGGQTQTTIVGQAGFDGAGSDQQVVSVIIGPVPPVGTEIELTILEGTPDGDGEGMLYAEMICFTPGTKIMTPQGEVAVEDLEVGDLVVTRDRGAQPLRWVGSRKVPAEGMMAPVTIKAGVLGNDRDLVVSPAHRILIEGWQAEALFQQSEVLATARQLTVREDVFVTEGGEVEYFHLLFDNHEIITANGAACESLNPSDLALDALETEQRAEIRALFPELLVGGGFPIARPMLRDTDVAVLG